MLEMWPGIEASAVFALLQGYLFGRPAPQPAMPRF
jgi:hydrogenase/urease accessory protein HupE